jgi:threonine dehydratase
MEMAYLVMYKYTNKFYLNDFQIFLKLENLQPIGSFKLRGAMNAVRKLPLDTLKHGVFTASAGNFAQGLAWYAKQAQVTCNVMVPNHAPHTKVSAVEKLGGIVTKVDFDRWWQVIETHKFNGMEGTFVHPVCEPDVIAGNIHPVCEPDVIAGKILGVDFKLLIIFIHF